MSIKVNFNPPLTITTHGPDGGSMTVASGSYVIVGPLASGVIVYPYVDDNGKAAGYAVPMSAGALAANKADLAAKLAVDFPASTATITLG